MSRGTTVAAAAGAMFLVGTLAAVSDLIKDYPLYGGQTVRYAVAALIMFVIMKATSRPGAHLTVKDFGLLVALALTGLVLFNVCVVESTRGAGPALVGTMLATVPLVMAVVTTRRPRPRLVVAAGIVVAGALLATGLGGGGVDALLWALGAVACEVCFSLLALPLLPKLGAVGVTAWSVALAVPLLAVAGVIADGPAVLRVPTAPEALGFAYLASVVTCGAFFLWYTALPRLGPGRAGLFAGVIPVGAITTGTLIGLGLPSDAELAGATIVVCGIVVGLLPDRPVRVRVLHVLADRPDQHEDQRAHEQDDAHDSHGDHSSTKHDSSRPRV
ncbi:DMT family transporter [Herbidospora sp. NBRC 101105]|uniref:DMT family transporter n=1 Tax=Herbidospora sp. NBRC 101105 TaxID=3032195 RepID=UPI0024A32043|nr:DMT family transporter [Herbidospora sp. NBRC 101105]GLX98894.1 membrane protein [Herbidospora sp. NBRC 101105]